MNSPCIGRFLNATARSILQKVEEKLVDTQRVLPLLCCEAVVDVQVVSFLFVVLIRQVYHQSFIHFVRQNWSPCIISITYAPAAKAEMSTVVRGVLRCSINILPSIPTMRTIMSPSP